MLKKYSMILVSLLALVLCNSAFSNCKRCDSHKKVVLITGGASGIGAEVAKSFDDKGWTVWITTRNQQKYNDLEGFNLVDLDLNNKSQMTELVERVIKEEGHIDVLVNNAGYGVLGPVEAVSLTQAEEQFAINFFAPMHLTQAVLPHMRARKKGHIINISSTSGMRAVPGLGIYAASKMALEGMSEALAAELQPWNIQVSLVQPGSVNNQWSVNCTEAENMDREAAYSRLTTNLKTALVEYAAKGQDEAEIGRLVYDVATNTASKTLGLKVQTNAQAESVAKDVYADSTGLQLHQKMSNWAKQLYEAS